MKRLILLLVFLVGAFGSVLAQSEVDVTNKSAGGSYDGGIAVYTNVMGGGSISFHTGSVSSILDTGGTFSGGGGWFNYTLPTVGSGNATNLAGSLAMLSGTNTVHKYQMTLTFSGVDTQGRAFSGTSIQLLTVKHNQKGAFSVEDHGGTTTLEF